MKKIILYFLVLFIGIIAGYSYALTQKQKQTVTVDTRERQFQIRTEEYLPSCSELQRRNGPSLTSKGSDHFLVISRKEDFIVFGVNSEGDRPPISFWWSAGVNDAIKQSCK